MYIKHMNSDVTLTVDLNAAIPVYRQIVDALRHYLVEGKIQAGDVLPPVRQLGIDLGVHFNTVAQAYRILANEGWLELKRRRGATVLLRRNPARADKSRLAQFRRRLRELAAHVRSEGVPAPRIADELRELAERLDSKGGSIT
jgi:GntR family transcriptional regulator